MRVISADRSAKTAIPQIFRKCFASTPCPTCPRSFPRKYDTSFVMTVPIVGPPICSNDVAVKWRFWPGDRRMLSLRFRAARPLPALRLSDRMWERRWLRFLIRPFLKFTIRRLGMDSSDEHMMVCARTVVNTPFGQ
ncbi:PREDICTED: uncharacterized protein LOC106813224 [Priapulus caudatus]|uniref:Uncharacterized protein LOC106813224 n=1 Tax=Priapulus caudatus TaxID=37621 RepID=A0ABM1EKR9_PRICU|nr:PREDICTED: uncharacterized protein LOC106813224 [Priapulus caudatus]